MYNMTDNVDVELVTRCDTRLRVFIEQYVNKQHSIVLPKTIKDDTSIDTDTGSTIYLAELATPTPTLSYDQNTDTDTYTFDYTNNTIIYDTKDTTQNTLQLSNFAIQGVTAKSIDINFDANITSKYANGLLGPKLIYEYTEDGITIQDIHQIINGKNTFTIIQTNLLDGILKYLNNNNNSDTISINKIMLNS